MLSPRPVRAEPGGQEKTGSRVVSLRVLRWACADCRESFRVYWSRTDAISRKRDRKCSGQGRCRGFFCVWHYGGDVGKVTCRGESAARGRCPPRAVMPSRGREKGARRALRSRENLGAGRGGAGQPPPLAEEAPGLQPDPQNDAQGRDPVTPRGDCRSLDLPGLFQSHLFVHLLMAFALRG